MTQQGQAIQRQQPQSLKALLESPSYLKRFEEILGKRTPQFVSSLLSVGTALGSNTEPKSIITAAMTAATLDLPIDKNLGFAWIVPYKGKGQFQMGYKGYIQLGLRTGQYERMNARQVNAEAFQGWDEVGEPIIDWSQIDESKPTVGYVFAFKLVNGFTKIAYWPRERVEEHAKKFSQSYGGKYDSPWKSNFDAMALKTVIKNELARWGILSIEMQQAIKLDQATQEDIDAEPHYLDGIDTNGNGHKPALEVISEGQRSSLVELAKTHGVVESLGEIVNSFGFELIAHITVDRYDEVLVAIQEVATAKQPEPANEEVIQGEVVLDGPVAENAASDEVAKEAQSEESALDPDEEGLREYVQSMFDDLTKNRQKDFLAGRDPISKANMDTLTKYKDELEDPKLA